MIFSTYRPLWHHKPIEFPSFTGVRLMMMPVRLGHLGGVPQQYCELVDHLYSCTEHRFWDDIGYLTIDEQQLMPGETLRRGGMHVDGYYHGRCGAWGGGGGWGSVGNGMLVVSSTAHCCAHLGLFDGEPGPEGECDHIASQAGSQRLLANIAYWLDGACIHESMPAARPTRRQFVRLSMPNNGPWFEGYTPNPTGIRPTGEILARRSFMRAEQ